MMRVSRKKLDIPETKALFSFACKTMSLDDLIRCGFNLSKSFYELLSFMLSSNKKFSVRELAKHLGKERSSVQKLLKELLLKGVVKRAQVNLSTGGYSYVYAAVDKEYLKKRLLDNLKRWTLSAENQIKKW